MSIPKLSIITINLNNKVGLEKTIRSVIGQTFNDYEYIIIDGASTDGSLNVIEQYAACIDYWVSELDSGIYNAMNKGIHKALGKYLLFLNSGDYLLTVEVLANVFSLENNEDILYGQIETKHKLLVFPEKLSLRHFFYGSIGHPAAFISNFLFDKYGGYNESLRIVSDWEFFIKAIIIDGATYKSIPFPVSFFDENGISNDRNKYREHREERKQVLEAFFPRIYVDYLEFDKVRKKLIPYENSFLIRLIRKFHQSRIYQLFKS